VDLQEGLVGQAREQEARQGFGIGLGAEFTRSLALGQDAGHQLPSAQQAVADPDAIELGRLVRDLAVHELVQAPPIFREALGPQVLQEKTQFILRGSTEIQELGLEARLVGFLAMLDRLAEQVFLVKSRCNLP